MEKAAGTVEEGVGGVVDEVTVGMRLSRVGEEMQKVGKVMAEEQQKR